MLAVCLLAFARASNYQEYGADNYQDYGADNYQDYGAEAAPYTNYQSEPFATPVERDHGATIFFSVVLGISGTLMLAHLGAFKACGCHKHHVRHRFQNLLGPTFE